jgi:hypothetical protein
MWGIRGKKAAFAESLLLGLLSTPSPSPNHAAVIATPPIPRPSRVPAPCPNQAGKHLRTTATMIQEGHIPDRWWWHHSSRSRTTSLAARCATPEQAVNAEKLSEGRPLPGEANPWEGSLIIHKYIQKHICIDKYIYIHFLFNIHTYRSVHPHTKHNILSLYAYMIPGGIQTQKHHALSSIDQAAEPFTTKASCSKT